MSTYAVGMRLGILTGGGDCPGLNAAIRAIVRKATTVYGDEVVGFFDAWDGVLERRYTELNVDTTRGILRDGGTILGTRRGSPFDHHDGIERVQSTLSAVGIDALLVLGGNGSLTVASLLHERIGLPVIGLPKTIDNDVPETDATFGYSTAVQIATDSIDRLHTTAESHDRVVVVEVMGREAGWIALNAGIAGGATVILIPEKPFDIDQVAHWVSHRHGRGRYASIVVVAEGADPIPGTLEVPHYEKDKFGHLRLGGIGAVVAAGIEERTGFETRVTQLGLVQRGGTPNARDRILATQLGLAAVTAAHDGDFGTMMAARGTDIVRVPLRNIANRTKTVEVALYDEIAGVFFG